MYVMFGGLGDKWYKQLIGPLQLAIPLKKRKEK